jgi:hypothetical protein
MCKYIQYVYTSKTVVRFGCNSKVPCSAHTLRCSGRKSTTSRLDPTNVGAPPFDR